MSMRDGVCPECGHREVIVTEAAEFSDGSEYRMSVTYDTRIMFPGRSPEYGSGPLTLYTCRSCGLTQWYAAKPDSIPIDEKFRTRLIKG